MVNALIVDDEKHNVIMLQSLLKENCPEINVIGFSYNVDEAFEKINSLKPKLVFLDIKMPGKSGFDLLRLFDEITFEVIFVSAYNEYAITAFEFNALGYILKPIDYMALQKTVKRTISIIEGSHAVNSEMTQFVKTLEDKGDKINKVSVHQNDKVILIDVPGFVYIKANVDFSEINLTNKSIYHSNKTLKQFEDLLNGIGSFIRINKSIIVNTDHILSYTKGDICEITVKTGQTFEVSRRKKTEIISILKERSILY